MAFIFGWSKYLAFLDLEAHGWSLGPHFWIFQKYAFLHPWRTFDGFVFFQIAEICTLYNSIIKVHAFLLVGSHAWTVTSVHITLRAAYIRVALHIHWNNDHVCMLMNFSNFQLFQLRTFPTSNFSNLELFQPLTFPFSNFPNFELFQLRTFPTSNFSIFEHFQLQTFPTSNFSNFELFQLQTFPTSNFSNLKLFQLI